MNSIWRARTVLIHEGVKVNVDTLLLSCHNRMNEFLKNGEKDREMLLEEAEIVRSWRPPDEGFIEINVDASTVEENFARDNLSRLVSLEILKVVCGVAEGAEAYAFLKGVELAVRKGWKMVIFEGDCQILVNTLNKNIKLVACEFQHLIAEARDLCSFFEFFDFSWIPRNYNVMARSFCIWGRDLFSVGPLKLIAFCLLALWGGSLFLTGPLLCYLIF